MKVQMGYITLSLDTPDEVFTALLAVLGNEPLAAILEHDRQRDGLCLDDKLASDQALPALRSWPQGRLFNEQGDVRWEYQPAHAVHLVIVSQHALPATIQQPLTLTEVGPPQHLLLWGERPTPERMWDEGRIPDLARYYPNAWRGPNAAIRVQTYEADWAAAATVRVVTRYLALVPDYTIS